MGISCDTIRMRVHITSDGFLELSENEEGSKTTCSSQSVEYGNLGTLGCLVVPRLGVMNRRVECWIRP